LKVYLCATMPSNAQKNSESIKAEAYRLGFAQCGIAAAEFLEEEAPRLERWLKNGQHGTMAYMDNHFDKRLDPRLLVDGARSVISLSLNYFPAQRQSDPEAPKISKYAYGQDYHQVIKEKLILLLEFICQEIGEVNGRAFTDSAPVLDRAWARRSGIGWVAKNSNIISKNNGSFFFLAELIIDLELQYDQPFQTDHCGSCTRCIDACPTDAIVSPAIVDGSKCISYLTIELKDEIPDHFAGKMENWIFGCDICQDVCPWNRFAVPNAVREFQPNERLLNMKKEDWFDITQEVFSTIFKNSAVKRTKFKGLTRNIDFIKSKA
jgi:epoxyqueuosine reductase